MKTKCLVLRAAVLFHRSAMLLAGYYDNWESESKTLEQSHGAVVSKKNGVYTYSDGYTHTMSGGSNWGFTSLGDFFYGIGDLFAAFYL